MTRRRLTLLAAMLASYALLCFGACVAEPWLVYQPSRSITHTPAEDGMPFEDVSLVTEDAVRLHAWFVPVENPRATVLFAHGTRGNVSTQIHRLRAMHDAGLAVLVFDYRGYGRSEGGIADLSEEATYRDAEAAWRWLVEERGVLPEDIVIWGRSLGGGVASWLAAAHPPQALVLESTYTSLVAVAAKEAFFLPVHRLSRIRYPTKDRLAHIDCPVVIAHAPDDSRIPYWHADENFAAAPGPKIRIQLVGGHGKGISRTPGAIEKVVAFLDGN